jgi:hypothetical protein
MVAVLEMSARFQVYELWRPAQSEAEYRGPG